MSHRRLRGEELRRKAVEVLRRKAMVLHMRGKPAPGYPAKPKETKGAFPLRLLRGYTSSSPRKEVKNEPVRYALSSSPRKSGICWLSSARAKQIRERMKVKTKKLVKMESYKTRNTSADAVLPPLPKPFATRKHIPIIRQPPCSIRRELHEKNKARHLQQDDRDHAPVHEEEESAATLQLQFNAMKEKTCRHRHGKPERVHRLEKSIARGDLNF